MSTEISIVLFGDYNFSEDFRYKLESTFKDNLLQICSNVDILKNIQYDEIEGINASVDHFEGCESAWSHIMSNAYIDTMNMYGGVLKDGSNLFEVTFS